MSTDVDETRGLDTPVEPGRQVDWEMELVRTLDDWVAHNGVPARRYARKIHMLIEEGERQDE